VGVVYLQTLSISHLPFLYLELRVTNWTLVGQMDGEDLLMALLRWEGRLHGGLLKRKRMPIEPRNCSYSLIFHLSIFPYCKYLSADL
jgi:hypothetical protein